MLKYLQLLGIGVLCILLNACVTTNDKPSKSVNMKKVLETRVQLGMRYLESGNRDGARRQFREALDIDKRSAEAHQGMALVHQLNGEMELAEENFRKALRLRADISKSGIHFSYGRFLFNEERFDEACEQFEIAAKDLDFESRPEALYFAGRCARVVGKKERAFAALQHSINLDPRMTSAMLELAEMHYEERNYPEAKSLLDQYSSLVKHDARSLWLGIRIERIFGNKDKEGSYVIALKNMYPYSKEYLEYKRLLGDDHN